MDSGEDKLAPRTRYHQFPPFAVFGCSDLEVLTKIEECREISSAINCLQVLARARCELVTRSDVI